jgi:hypothetical protein
MTLAQVFEGQLVELVLADPALVPTAAACIASERLTDPLCRRVVSELFAIRAAGGTLQVGDILTRINDAPEMQVAARRLHAQAIAKWSRTVPEARRQALAKVLRHLHDLLTDDRPEPRQDAPVNGGEVMFLAAILADSALIPLARETVDPSKLTRPALAMVYRWILELDAAGPPADQTTFLGPQGENVAELAAALRLVGMYLRLPAAERIRGFTHVLGDIPGARRFDLLRNLHRP